MTDELGRNSDMYDEADRRGMILTSERKSVGYSSGVEEVR